MTGDVPAQALSSLEKLVVLPVNQTGFYEKQAQKVKQNEETEKYDPNKRIRQIFRKKNSCKEAQWTWEKSGWIQYELWQRGRKCKKKKIRVEEYST